MKRFFLAVAAVLALTCSLDAAPKQQKKPALRATVTAHSVQLNWTNPSEPVQANVSNKLYKCTGTAAQCPVGSASFAPVSPAPTSTTYTDTSVAAGTSYVYQVTAVCATSCGTPAVPVIGEGPASNQVVAVTPADPVVPGAPTLNLQNVL